jgi:tRNA modification GTPase
LGALYRGWAEELRRLLANAEAAIDFSDQDLPEIEDAPALARLTAALALHLADGRSGERVREGLTIVVAGPPNAGKSSLINALAGRDVAIVAPTPGTTRDPVEARIVAGSLPVTLIDTAGLRESPDPIEAEGVRRARARAASADLVLAVTDASCPVPFPLEATVPVLAIANKTDLAPAPAALLPVSALTGAGLPELRARIAEMVGAIAASAGPPPLTRARHRAALRDAQAALAAAAAAPAPELRAEELRAALAALGRITGSVGVEDILATIFSSFCIGK